MININLDLVQIIKHFDETITNYQRKLEQEKENPRRLRHCSALIEKLDEAFKELTKALNGSGTPRNSFTAAFTTFEKKFNLDRSECIQLKEKIQKEIQDDHTNHNEQSNFLFRRQKSRRKIDEISNKIDKLQEMISDLWSDVKEQCERSEAQQKCSERFVKSYSTVPFKQENLEFDFNDIQSPERRLKDLVMNPSDKSNSMPIFVHGPGASGKTSALIALGNDENVRNKYAIVFIKIGIDVSEGGLKLQLRKIVESSGGEEYSKEIPKCDEIYLSILKTQQWFRNESVLFLVDDLHIKSGKCYLKDLKGLLKCSEKSRMVISTTDDQVAQESINNGLSAKFDYLKPDSEKARKILLKSTGFNWDDVNCDKDRGNIKSILGHCHGIQYLLSMANSQILMKNRRENTSLSDAISSLRKSLDSNDNFVTKEHPDWPGNEHVKISFTLMVRAMLDQTEDWLRHNRRIDATELSENQTITSLFHRFSVLLKQSFVPRDIIRSIFYGIRPEVADMITDKLVQLHLIEKRTVGDVDTYGIHDKIIDTIVNNKTIVNVKFRCDVHGGFIDSIFKGISDEKSCDVSPSHTNVTEENNYRLDFQHVKSSGRKWWLIQDKPFETYLSTNLARHLFEGKKISELVALLIDARWTCYQLGRNGLAELVSHDDILFEWLNLRKDEHHELWEALDLLRHSVRLYWPYLSKDRLELKTQIFGSLFGRNSSPFLEQFLKTAQELAPKMWIKPLQPYYIKPTRTDDFLIPLHAWATHMDVCRKTKIAVVAAEKDIMIIDLENIKVTDVNGVYGCDEGAEIKMLMISPLGDSIALTNTRGKLIIYKLEKKDKLCSDPKIIDGIENAYYVVFSSSGKEVLSVGYDGKLNIWDVETGEKINEKYGRLVNEKCVISTQPVASSGDRIAFINGEKSIIVFNIENMEEEFSLSIDSENEFKLSHLSFGRSPKYLVSISNSSEETNMCLWDLDQQNSIKSKKDKVKIGQIDFSSERQWMAARSTHGDIYIWDTQINSFNRIGAHIDEEGDIAFYRDGNQLISCSDERAVRIWDLNNLSSTSNKSSSDRYFQPIKKIAINKVNGKTWTIAISDRNWNIWYSDSCGSPQIRSNTGHLQDEARVLKLIHSFDSFLILSVGRNGRDVKMEVGSEKLWKIFNIIKDHFDLKLEDEKEWPSLAFSGNCSRFMLAVTIGRRSKLYICDLENGNNVIEHKTYSYRGVVTSVFMSADGFKAVFGSDDGYVTFWDLCKNSRCSFRNHSKRVYSVSLSPLAKLCASSSYDCSAYVWRIASDSFKPINDEFYSDTSFQSTCTMPTRPSAVAISDFEKGNANFFIGNTNGKLTEFKINDPEALQGCSQTPDSTHISLRMTIVFVIAFYLNLLSLSLSLST